jgi:hypothetical protein
MQVQAKDREQSPVRPAALQRKAAAAYCGMKVDAFDKNVRPHVPPLYVGGLRLWLASELDAFLSACPRAEVA